MWTARSSLWVMVWVAVCASPTLTIATTSAPPAPSCPEACHCLTTLEGLHKAVCADLLSLHKFSIRNRHHNINVIDLSDANIVKINGELDRFTEVVSIDLSSNKISHLNKLLRSSKKLVHLNLSNNKLKRFSSSVIPSSVSSLDLSQNMLRDVPTDLHLLVDLEHLQLIGNPLQCTCSNLKQLELLRSQGAIIDNVKCISPLNLKGISWAEVKVSEICVDKKNLIENHKDTLLEDMMMGDQPMDTEDIAVDTTNRKSMPLTDLNHLNGEVFESSGVDENDDDKVFLGVTTENSNTPFTEQPDIFESSGDSENFEVEEVAVAKKSSELSAQLNADVSTTEEPGSGDSDIGSGIIARGGFKVDEVSTTTDLYGDSYDYDGSGDDAVISTSTTTEPFITGLFSPFFRSGNIDDNSTVDEPIDMSFMPTLFQGKIDWDAEPSEKPSTEEPPPVVPPVEEVIVKTERVEDEAVVKMSDNSAGSLNEEYQEEPSKQPVKSSMGTYICIGILIALLVGLVAVTVIRNHTRKIRDRRLIRQERKDIEKGGKELVDMNKSLLGKPVALPNEGDKKTNGNYELVPTHDPRKSNRNGTLDSRKSVDENIQKAEAPEQNSANPSKPNSSPSKPQTNQIPRVEEPSEQRPFNSIPDGPHSNGGKNLDTHLLPPPNDYIPVYNADSGRVRIRLTETPRPKTPVLVTRSRSNAGDIIITPAAEQNSPSKSTT